MTIDKSSLFIDEHGRRLVHIDQYYFYSFNYSISKKFNLEVNLENIIGHNHGRIFHYALAVKDGLIYESLLQRLAILELHNSKILDFARFIIEEDYCQYPLNRMKRSTLEPGDEAVSFLYHLCKVKEKNGKLFVLKKDDPWIAILLNESDKEDLVLTIRSNYNLENNIVKINYVASNASISKLEEKV